jgi:sec-independent protein translocase protein TatA
VRVGVTELLVILAIVLLMFGSKKLPELADGMGKAIKNFKRGINSDDEDVTPPPPAAPATNQQASTLEDKQQVPQRTSVNDLSSEANHVGRKS